MQKLLGLPNRAGKSYPKATSMASSRGPACCSPRVTRFKPFKRLNIRLACLIPQPTGTPRPHQWLLMGVQACRLPGLKRFKGFKTLKTLQNFLGTPNGAGKSYPKATFMASSGRSSLPFARRYTLETFQTLKRLLGMPNPAANRHPKATSMASCGRPSLPFARPYTLKTLKTPLGMPHPAANSDPGPHQWLLLGVQACRLPGLKRLKGLKPLKPCKSLSERPTAQAKATPRPHQWLLLGVQASRSPGVTRLKSFKRLNIFLACL